MRGRAKGGKKSGGNVEEDRDRGVGAGAPRGRGNGDLLRRNGGAGGEGAERHSLHHGLHGR